MVRVPYFFFISSAAGLGRVERLLKQLRIGQVLEPIRASFSFSVRGRASVLALAVSLVAARSRPAPAVLLRNPRRSFMGFIISTRPAWSPQPERFPSQRRLWRKRSRPLFHSVATFLVGNRRHNPR